MPRCSETEPRLKLDTISILLFFLHIFLFLSIVLTMLSQCNSFFLSCMLTHLFVLSFFQNFLFSSKDENSPLKVIDFGLSDFVKPGLSY